MATIWYPNKRTRSGICDTPCWLLQTVDYFITYLFSVTRKPLIPLYCQVATYFEKI